MDAPGFIKVLEKGLLPFVKNVLPDHRLMQDNDPKHTSRLVRSYLEDNQIHWWKTPSELIQSKIFGMSSKNTKEELLNPEQRRS